MLLKIFSLTCLFLIKFFIEPTICAAPNNIQNLELDDVTSLWDKFPFLIDKIKEAVSRFRCPKGWKRLGGSCYYFSNFTSITSHVNYTCNHLHSNLSNLMQIRNAVELFYAAHVLSRNNLSSLMIEIDSNLLKGRKITEMLMNDQGRWGRMKKQLQEIRVKYQRLKQKIVDQLTTVGLRIFRRSKKIKPIPPKPESSHDEIDIDQSHEYEYDYRESNITYITFPNNTIMNITSIIDNDEYEYDDLDSSDESDEFEQIENIRGICDDIHWNVLNNTNNSTVYILTKYNMSDKTVCSLSDVQPYTKYHHVCEYVLDFCFANVVCGNHGRCLNTLAGFKCSCSFLYGGLLCEKISAHGYQILISFIFIIILTALSFEFIRNSLWFIIKLFINLCKKHCKSPKQKKGGTQNDTQRLLPGDRPDKDDNITGTLHEQQRRPTFAQEFVQFILQKTSNSLLSPVKRNLVRNILVGSLSVIFLTSLFVITTIMYFLSFGYNLTTDEEHVSINDTIRLVNDCTRISDYRRGNLLFAPLACALILLFSWSVKREILCLDMCEGRPGLIPPIEPFRTGNRFTTATVFGILAFEVLKIFEELLFSTGQPLQHGVLIELLERIALIIVVGLRYYPVLASLQLRNIVTRFFACWYIICNIIYTIVREGSCMGFLPLSGEYTAVEEAKLRRELGTWFIVYGLIKNLPHFFFLSYIGAELCVRFGYDSVYVPLKKNESIWSAPIVQSDESEFAKYYVTKLFRRNPHRSQTFTDRNINADDVIDYEHVMELQNRANQSRFQKFINSIYHFDDDFRFTTLAMCTYTVAFVFLYYLSCTFVFLYISRTTGHVAFLKFYFESTFNIDLGAFSLKTEIIVSAIFTAVLYGGQLYIGMQNYKKHKLQLYRGIYADIPSVMNFKTSSIAANSVHYSGFLVGYMAWGFVICFHLILLICIGIRVLSLQIRNIEIALGIIVPILVIYLLKMLSMASAGKYLFFPKQVEKLNLRSRKTYAVFIYFSFFADCFLGIASCIIRLIKATCLNVVFMARLDWSFLGRPLEKFDVGFAAYVSYLHMEVTYTNPVMQAFCYSLYDDIIQQRPKRYVDECCIAPSEFEDEADIELRPRQTQVQQNRTNLPRVISRRPDNNNEPTQDNSDFHGDERVSKITSHLQELPSIKNISEIKSKNQSTILIKENPKNSNRKMKQQQQSNIVDEGKQSTTLATVRHIGFAPEIPPRADHPSEQDETDDGIDNNDEDLKPKSFLAVEELIPKPQPRLKSLPQSSKIDTDSRTDEDEDDGVPKRTESIKKKNLKKRKKAISRPNILPEDNDTLQPSKHLKGASSITHGVVDRQVFKISDNIRHTKIKRTTDKNPYDTIPTEEERTTKVTINPNEIYPLRTISYRQAQENTPPLTLHQPNISSVTRNQNNTNDDSSHYSEITNDTTRSSVSNHSNSTFVVTEAPTSHSNKQKIPEKEKENDDTDVEIEEEEKEEQAHLLQAEPTSLPSEPIVIPTVDVQIKSEEENEKERIKRRKRLRFRWHFLYTIVRNYQLFDLRKDVHNRLTLLHIQRSNLTDERQLTTTISTLEVSKAAKRGADSGVVMAEAQVFDRSVTELPTPINQRPLPPKRSVSVPVSITSDYPPSPAERYVAIRAQMLYDANSQQPTTPPYPPSVSRVPTTVSGYIQQLRPPITTTLSGQSLGFQVSPDIIVHPPSERSLKLGSIKATTHSTAHVLSPENVTSSTFQPASTSNQSTADYPLAGSSIVNSSTYRTQMSHEQQMQVWRQEQVEKIQKKHRHCYIYGVPRQSNAVDRVTSASILTPQIIPVTKQQQAPPTSPDGKTERGPTPSVFYYPPPSSQMPSAPSSTISDTQPKTRNQNSRINRSQQEAPIPPQRMERLDEDSQETSNTNKSSTVTSALIHRKDSQSSTTDITEI